MKNLLATVLIVPAALFQYNLIMFSELLCKIVGDCFLPLFEILSGEESPTNGGSRCERGDLPAFCVMPPVQLPLFHWLVVLCCQKLESVFLSLPMGATTAFARGERREGRADGFGEAGS